MTGVYTPFGFLRQITKCYFNMESLRIFSVFLGIRKLKHKSPLQTLCLTTYTTVRMQLSIISFFSCTASLFQLSRFLRTDIFNAPAFDAGITKHLCVPTFKLLFVALRDKSDEPRSRNQVSRYRLSSAFAAFRFHYVASSCIWMSLIIMICYLTSGLDHLSIVFFWFVLASLWIYMFFHICHHTVV